MIEKGCQSYKNERAVFIKFCILINEIFVENLLTIYKFKNQDLVGLILNETIFYDKVNTHALLLHLYDI